MTVVTSRVWHMYQTLKSIGEKLSIETKSRTDVHSLGCDTLPLCTYSTIYHSAVGKHNSIVARI